MIVSFAKDDVLENKPLELGEMKMTLQGFLKEAEAEFKALDDELKKMDGPFFAGKEVVNLKCGLSSLRHLLHYVQGLFSSSTSFSLMFVF